jgi:hypothetical protein
MKINPSSPNNPRTPVDAAALDSARTAEARKSEGSAAKTAVDADLNRSRADTADVSAEARALAGQQGSPAARSSLPADRLKEISERLESGFYDRPEVIAQVARGVANDPDFVDRG